MTFGRKTWERKPQPLYAKVECRGTYATPDVRIRASAKSAPVRSERYRRLVAAYPCIHCGIADLSQCAHGNTGKGMGMKTDDRNTFPLCADSPGRPGCHPRFDQHALFPRAVVADIEQAWAADTRRRINAAGLWPAEVPQWEELEHP